MYRFCSPLSFSLIPDVGKLTLAVLAGLEPAISAVTGRRPLQLDCRTKLPVVTANHQMISSIYLTNRIFVETVRIELTPDCLQSILVSLETYAPRFPFLRFRKSGFPGFLFVTLRILLLENVSSIRRKP